MPASPPSRRRTVVWVAGGFFAIATVVVFGVVGVSSATSGAASVLIGSLDATSLLSVSVFLAFGALCVGLWAIGSPRWMLPLKIVGVVLAACAGAIAAFVSVLTVDANVTPLLQDGCDTGYVVVERSFLMGSSGTVYRLDGTFIVTQMARTSGDNGYQPFSMGGYAVTETDGSLTVSYSVNRPSEGTGVAPASGSSLSVPVLERRTPHCGLQPSDGRLSTPSPTTPSDEPAPVTAEAVDDELRGLLAASFAAASGTVVDAEGTPIDASALPTSSGPCPDAPGTWRELQIAFRTDDNARSLTQILEVWDQAGYEKDRAMHEDIRYSESLPVTRMSIKNTSSIDGLIHLALTSACFASE